MTTAGADRPFVFVSYAHEDKELCRRLVLMLGLVLGERGYRVWWDQTLVAGAWRDQIDASLDRSVASLLLRAGIPWILTAETNRGSAREIGE